MEPSIHNCRGPEIDSVNKQFPPRKNREEVYITKQKPLSARVSRGKFVVDVDRITTVNETIYRKRNREWGKYFSFQWKSRVVNYSATPTSSSVINESSQFSLFSTQFPFVIFSRRFCCDWPRKPPFRSWYKLILMERTQTNLPLFKTITRCLVLSRWECPWVELPSCLSVAEGNVFLYKNLPSPQDKLSRMMRDESIGEILPEDNDRCKCLPRVHRKLKLFSRKFITTSKEQLPSTSPCT